MSDSLPPVAIRVARPYATEDELLENELETLTRTSITLLGAQPRPQGLMLRFELVLSSGQALVRGEGRVVGYKPDAFYGMGGLTLRFTRLDSRSKALVDKAAAMRERRRPFATTALVETPSLAAPPIRVEDLGQESPSPGPDRVAAGTDGTSGPPPRRTQPWSDPPRAHSSPEISPAPACSVADATAGEKHLAGTTPSDRDVLLERLRARSKALDGDAVRKILERRH